MDRPRRIEVIDDATAAMFRRFTPAERFAKIDEAYRSARWIILAGIRDRHPDWTEEQCQDEASRRISGDAAA